MAGGNGFLKFQMWQIISGFIQIRSVLWTTWYLDVKAEPGNNFSHSFNYKTTINTLYLGMIRLFQPFSGMKWMQIRWNKCNNNVMKAPKEQMKMFTDYNDILSVEDVCEILVIGRNRVYELLNTGLLKGFRIGRSWRIPKKSLESYVIQQCRNRVWGIPVCVWHTGTIFFTAWAGSWAYCRD